MASTPISRLQPGEDDDTVYEDVYTDPGQGSLRILRLAVVVPAEVHQQEEETVPKTVVNSGDDHRNVEVQGLQQDDRTSPVANSESQQPVYSQISRRPSVTGSSSVAEGDLASSNILGGSKSGSPLPWKESESFQQYMRRNIRERRRAGLHLPLSAIAEADSDVEDTASSGKDGESGV